MALLEEMTLPRGVELHRKPGEALLRVPADVALSDDRLLSALLDRLLAHADLRTLDVRVYESALSVGSAAPPSPR
jgi:hypothetical protein